MAYFSFCISSFNVMENNVTRTLVSYRNVKLRSFKIKKMFQFSKLWQWFLQSDWQNKSNRNELLWFALSYLILFKYGGTVLSWYSMTVNFIPEPGINSLIHQISITWLKMPISWQNKKKRNIWRLYFFRSKNCVKLKDF